MGRGREEEGPVLSLTNCCCCLTLPIATRCLHCVLLFNFYYLLDNSERVCLIVGQVCEQFGPDSSGVSSKGYCRKCCSCSVASQTNTLAPIKDSAATGKRETLGKHLFIRCHLYLGIAQIAITPPPHSNGHSGALFFRRDFTILPLLPFLYHFFTIFSE